MPQFLTDVFDFLTANLVWVIVIAVAIIVIIAIIIVLVVKAKKSKRRRAQAAESSVENEKPDEIYNGVPIAEVKESEPMDEQTLPQTESPVEQISPPPTADAAQTSVTEEVEKPSESAKPSLKGKRMTGKWIIEHKGAGEYSSKLCASNGEVMLTSEVYTKEEGARAGIATIIRATETGVFVIYREKSGNYYYKLKSANNRLLCVGEIYKTKDQCQKATESVKRLAADSPIAYEVVEGAKYITYTPTPISEAELKRGARGKWRVEPSDDGRFSAKLYANNGQLMLATEDVSSLKRATDSIETVKRNAAQGNFIIDRDKFGRYYYKLRNSQKSIICIGETYDRLDSCISAIESVRRFAATSE